jgi:hypothetical protein
MRTRATHPSAINGECGQGCWLRGWAAGLGIAGQVGFELGDIDDVQDAVKGGAAGQAG